MLKSSLYYGSPWQIWLQVGSKVTVCFRAQDCHTILHIALWVLEIVHVCQSLDNRGFLLNAVENLGHIVGGYLKVFTLLLHGALAQL